MSLNYRLIVQYNIKQYCLSRTIILQYYIRIFKNFTSKKILRKLVKKLIETNASGRSLTEMASLKPVLYVQIDLKTWS